jgi:hypothetical protein
MNMGLLENPGAVLVRKASSIYDSEDYNDGSQCLQPEPLDLSKKAFIQYDNIEGSPYAGFISA